MGLHIDKPGFPDHILRDSSFHSLFISNSKFSQCYSSNDEICEQETKDVVGTTGHFHNSKLRVKATVSCTEKYKIKTRYHQPKRMYETIHVTKPQKLEQGVLIKLGTEENVVGPDPPFSRHVSV